MYGFIDEYHPHILITHKTCACCGDVGKLIHCSVQGCIRAICVQKTNQRPCISEDTIDDPHAFVCPRCLMKTKSPVPVSRLISAVGDIFLLITLILSSWHVSMSSRTPLSISSISRLLRSPWQFIFLFGVHPQPPRPTQNVQRHLNSGSCTMLHPTTYIGISLTMSVLCTDTTTSLRYWLFAWLLVDRRSNLCNQDVVRSCITYKRLPTAQIFCFLWTLTVIMRLGGFVMVLGRTVSCL